ncbi:MAG: alkyl sulfatase dimerization domain-containing protein [Desulfomonilia bacterium]
MRSKLLAIAAVCMGMITGCAITPPLEPVEVAAHPDLAEHSSEFTKQVLTVTDGVHLAIGFGLANSILLEGDDGVIIVDTLESAEAAIPVKKEFTRITSKPVKAIIYTHFHSDHTFGARIMAGDDNPDVYSHASTVAHLDRIVNITRDITYKRAMRMFGTLLPEGGLVNDGIGPFLAYDKDSTVALLRPTRTFKSEYMDLEIAGVSLRLIHAPGETPDQIVVWLPDKKVLLCADDYYKSFPNLYTIRGTAYRDVLVWVKSLDMMRTLRPEILVPGHTLPLYGADTIYETLTNYRDAIQFVHDQTIRHMNAGLTPDEIVELVKLPPHLASQPYLQEYYGTVEFSVRDIFDGYLGWFSGNATDLKPLSPAEEALRFASLAGGRDNLLEHARHAVQTGDHQWALVLTDHLIHLNDERTPEARSLRAAALNARAEQQISAPARNYYLTQALEVENRIAIGTVPKSSNIDLVHSIPLEALFSAMAVSLDPEKSSEVDTIVGFRFPDTGEAYTVHVRRGVAEIQPTFPANPDNTLTVDSFVWKEITAGIRNPALALVSGDVAIDGGTLDLIRFLRLFGTD